MANYALGELLRAARAYTGLSQEELSWGICSPVELSLIENGKVMPTIKVLRQLMKKLGKEGFPYAAFLTYPRVERYYIWKRIQEAAQRKDVHELENCVRQGMAKKETDIIYNQYLMYAEALLQRLQNKDSKEVLQKFLEAIKMTIPDIDAKQNLKQRRKILTYEEIIILYHLAIQYRYCHQYRKAKNLLYELKHYMEQPSIDIEQKKSIYPQLLLELSCLFMENYIEGEKIKRNHKIMIKTIEFCEDGINYCIKYGLLYQLMDILKYELYIFETIGKQEEKINRTIEIKCLRQIIEEYGNSKKMEFYATISSTAESGLCNYNIGELIYSLRKEANISMKDLCKGICSCSNMSRIENGEQIPREDMTRAFLERLGKNGVPYINLVSQRKMEWYALEHHVRNKIAWKEWSELEKVVNKLEECLPEQNKLAKQYILFAKAIVQEMIYNVEPDKILKILIISIRLTIPEYKFEDDVRNILLTYNEITIINSIARQFYKMGERMKAIRISYSLKENIEKRVKESLDKGRLYPGILVNLSQWLGVVGLYKESMEICHCGLEYCVIYGKFELLPYFLVNYGSDCANQKMPDRAKTYYQQAYYLYRIMNKVDNMNFICRAISEEFDIQLIN